MCACRGVSTVMSTPDACLAKQIAESTPAAPQSCECTPPTQQASPSLPPTCSPTPWQSLGMCPVVGRRLVGNAIIPEPGTVLTVAAEPSNRKHPHALRCMLDGDDAAQDPTPLGYLPRAVADALAPALACGHLHSIRMVVQGHNVGASAMVGMLQLLRSVGVQHAMVFDSLMRATDAASASMQVVGWVGGHVAYHVANQCHICMHRATHCSVRHMCS